jgi:hypothetical protein
MAGLAPAFGMGLLPKCPACLGAYLGILGSAGAATATGRTLWIGATSVAVGVAMGARVWRRRRLARPQPKPMRPCCSPSQGL